MLLAGIEGSSEGVFGGVTEGAHVQQSIGRRVESVSATQLVDPPGLLFGIELEVHKEHGAVLHLTPQPVLRASRYGYGKGECQQAFGHASVAVEQGDVSGQHEVFEEVAARPGYLYVREPHRFRLPSP